MVTLTINDMPESVRDQLAARAERHGRSLEDYVLDQLTRMASRPTPEDVAAQAARARQQVSGGTA